MVNIHGWRNATPDTIKTMPKELFDAVYADQEEINAHTENLLLQAKRFGNERQIDEATEILRLHAEKGYLDDEMDRRRHELSKALNSIAVQH